MFSSNILSVVRADAKTGKTSSQTSWCKKDDFPLWNFDFWASVEREKKIRLGMIHLRVILLSFCSFVFLFFFFFWYFSCVFVFNCFLRARCSMEMLCLDDMGRDSWDWVGPSPPTRERACFNSPEWCGSTSPVKTEPLQIVLLLLFQTRAGRVHVYHWVCKWNSQRLWPLRSPRALRAPKNPLAQNSDCWEWLQDTGSPS